MAGLARDEDTDISGSPLRHRSLVPWLLVGGGAIAAAIAIVTALFVTGVL